MNTVSGDKALIHHNKHKMRELRHRLSVMRQTEGDVDVDGDALRANQTKINSILFESQRRGSHHSPRTSRKVTAVTSSARNGLEHLAAC